jgi:uncharacterized membrane protein
MKQPCSAITQQDLDQLLRSIKYLRMRIGVLDRRITDMQQTVNAIQHNIRRLYKQGCLV